LSSRALTRALRAAAFATIPAVLAVQAVSAASPPNAGGLATRTNPYKNCTIGSGGSGTVNYTNSEVEPQVAVNPHDKSNVIGVVQQDRWNDGGAHGLVAMVSHDFGKSFHVVALPFSSCAPGGLNYERASDPWVSIGPDGTAYTVSISFDENSSRSDIAVATSTDQGETWGNVTEIDTQTALFDDKETVTADPVIAGTAYVVWDQSPDCCEFPEPSWFSKTTDWGATWSAPEQITATDAHFGDIGNEIVVNSQTGTLYDFFYRFYASSGPNQYLVINSTDGGATWSQPSVVANDDGIIVTDPHPGGEVIRTAAQAIGQAAIDPHTGRLYFAWEDARFSGGQYQSAAISTSTDGTHWSSPWRVSTNTGQSAFLPTVAVNSLGQVAVTYYDFRYYNPNDPTLPTSVWMKISPAGARKFSRDIVLRVHPFDMLTAPDAGGLFVGDYDGLAGRGKAFVSLYCSTTGDANNATDCYSRIVKPT
jgi:hypothetical protein